MEKLVCVDDFEREAMKNFGKSAKDYYMCGADDELTLKDNPDSFSRILLRPRMLRDVSKRDLSTTVLGKKVRVPLGIAPSAMQRLAHPDGECGSAKAADSIGGIMVLSIFATSSYEELAEVAPNGRKWAQFVMHKDRSLTAALIERAKKAGFEALVLSIDIQYMGNRRVLARSPIQSPPYLKFPNVPDEIDIHEKDLFDNAVTWEAVSWLKSVTDMPLVLKGILSADDARRAVELGVDGIWVSNHGGRQLDTVPAAVDILPSIVRAVGKTADVYADGGVRRGTDIYKLLALGADMVFVGRPALWGLAVDGTRGVTKVLEILREELDLTMALTGVADIKSITPSCVSRREELSKL